MEEFFCGTRIFSGSGSLRALESLNSRRLFLVTDPYFAENGWAEKVAALSRAECREIFDRVAPDPTVELAAAGTQRLREFGADTVVALGGGSAMDLAKAMVYFSGRKVCFVAIPTTSGSGSEVTDFAILTHGGVKHPLVDKALQPDVAILDGDLLEKLPRSLIADGGFDILSHALEAAVGKNADMFTDALAKEAFRLAFRFLPESFRGNIPVRQTVHGAATMAGMAFNRAGLGLCHSLSHSLGGAFHIPHGRLNAVLLPAVVVKNASVAAERYAALAQAAGLPGMAQTVAVRNLLNGLMSLRKTLGLPATLAEAGVPLRRLRQEMPTLVAAAVADPCSKTNPLPVTEALARQVLEEVAGRG